MIDWLTKPYREMLLQLESDDSNLLFSFEMYLIIILEHLKHSCRKVLWWTSVINAMKLSNIWMDLNIYISIQPGGVLPLRPRPPLCELPHGGVPQLRGVWRPVCQQFSPSRPQAFLGRGRHDRGRVLLLSADLSLRQSRLGRSVHWDETLPEIK